MCEPVHIRPNGGVLTFAVHLLVLHFFPLRQNQDFEVGEAAHNAKPVWRMEAIMLTTDKEISSNFPPRFPRLERGQSAETLPLKVLVVDDHSLTREALCSLIKELES